MASPCRAPSSVRHSDQAVAAATAIGFPVVLKGSVTGATHKTELQAVKLGLKDAEAVRVAWQDIAASIAAHDLTDAFTGCLVQEQVMPGPELLLSIRRDRAVRSAGDGGRRRHAGGTAARCGIGAGAAVARRCAADGTRFAHGQDCWTPGAVNPARDIAAIVDALVRLSWLAVDLGERLVDLEINPLIAGSVGAGVRAVDLRVEWAGAQ